MKRLWLLVVLIICGLILSFAPQGIEAKRKDIKPAKPDKPPSLIVEIDEGITLDTDIPAAKFNAIYRGKGKSVSKVVLTGETSPFYIIDRQWVTCEGFSVEVSEGFNAPVLGSEALTRHAHYNTFRDIDIWNPTGHSAGTGDYIAVQIKADGGNRAIHFTQLEKIWAQHCDTLLRLEATGDKNWIGQTQASWLWAEGYRILIDFLPTGWLDGNYFEYVCGQSTDYTEVGYNNIRRVGNMFVFPMVWDFRHYNDGPIYVFSPDAQQNTIICSYVIDDTEIEWNGAEDQANKIIHGGN